LVLRGTGWFITAVGSLFSIVDPFVPLTDRRSVLLAVVGFLGNLSAAVLFGRFLVVAASAGLTERRAHRLWPWARLVRIAGLSLCISWPCFLLGKIIQDLEFMRRFGAEAYFQFPYRDYVEVALPVILLGLVAIGCAEVWGRRQPPSDLSDVFS
jgi:hypothetical protein